jgi:CPA1 family monovalent cation:H+ antiporter
MRLEGQYVRQLDDIRAAIDDLHRTELVDDETRGLLLSLRALAEERSLYVDMFDRGHLSEPAFRELLRALELRVDTVRQRRAYHEAPLHRSALRYVGDAALRWIHRVPVLAPLAERLHWHRIARDYEVATGRLQGGRRVLDMLDTLGRVAATPQHVVERLGQQYQQQYDRAQHALDQMAEHFPEWITDMQERLARRLLLGAEADAIAQQVQHGTLPASVAERLTDTISKERHRLQGHDVSKLKLEPIALVQRMPWFQDIPATDLANIAVRMELQLAPARQAIVRQGEPGDYMYFIAHGVVRVTREEHGVSRDLATLKAGEFFGETALLGDPQPRNATITAVTACTLYRLHRDDLRVAMETQPGIRRVLEEESHKRAAGHQAE